ncbi:MAG TPA: PAS domain-containing protein [Candidatus Polarisedimenticolaceae bacterium]|nr:PAS domain-containing protein [Candidatus Polarisedimenticolaceae bacterium]
MEPTTEKARLAALDSYGVIGTPSDPVLDELTALAASVCDAPTAVLALIDAQRQWFKARFGIDALEAPRDCPLCRHATRRRELLVVPDLRDDPRFEHSSWAAPGRDMRFYAAAPLVTPEGLTIGTLCVMDTEARDLGPEQRRALETLARQVVAELELRGRSPAAPPASDVARFETAAALRASRDGLDSQLRERATELLAAQESLVATIGERERALAELRDWRERTGAALAGGTTVLEWEPATGRLLWSSSEAAASDEPAWIERIHPEDRAARTAALARGGDWEVDYRLRDAAGEYARVRERGREIADAAGQVLRRIASIEPREEHHQLEQRLARLRQITERSHDVLWLSRPQHGLLYVTPAYESIWQRPCAELYRNPQSFFQSVHPEDRDRVRAAHFRQTEGELEYRIVRPDGSVRWIHDRRFPLRDSTGRIECVAGVAADITDRKELESKLAAVRPLEDAGRLARTLAPELGAELSALAERVARVRGGLHPRDPLVHELEQLGETVERAARLSAPLLELAQASAAPTHDLNALLAELEPMLQRMAGPAVEVVTRTTPGLPAVSVDPAQLRQALGDLALRTRETLPEGGRLTCATDGGPDGVTLVVNEGEVTALTLRLPAAVAPVVLVVEDDPLVRDITVRALQTRGYEVLAAADGEEALRIGTAQASRLSLLLTDLVLPRRSGEEVADRLMQLSPQLRVLFISGYPLDADPTRGDRAFLRKPFTPSELEQRIRQLL